MWAQPLAEAAMQAISSPMMEIVLQFVGSGCLGGLRLLPGEWLHHPVSTVFGRTAALRARIGSHPAAARTDVGV